jgi:hypothetical protein
VAATPGRWLLSCPAKVAAIIFKQLEHATSKHNANHGDAGCWLLIMQMVVVAGKNVSLWGNFPHYPLGESTLKMLAGGYEVGDTMVNSLFISGNLDPPPP